MAQRFRASALLVLLGLTACESPTALDGGPRLDAGDAGRIRDAGPQRDGASPRDAGMIATRCPLASDPILSLEGVVLQPVAGVPIADGMLTGGSNMEGPVWIGDALLLSHFQNGGGRIYRVESSGAVSIARANTESNGLAIGVDGHLYLGLHGNGTVSWLPLDNLAATPTPVAAQFGGARFNSPNDLAIRSDGNVYFSDPTWQAPSPNPQPSASAYRIDREGNITRLANLPSQPNGVTLSLDESQLFIGGTNGLRVYSLDANGLVGGMTNVSSISGGTDGMGMDCLGNLYVTGSDRVTILSPDLDVLGDLDATSATNVAFGGADGRTLYVTAQGSPPRLYSAHLNVAGLPY